MLWTRISNWSILMNCWENVVCSRFTVFSTNLQHCCGKHKLIKGLSELTLTVLFVVEYLQKSTQTQLSDTYKKVHRRNYQIQPWKIKKRFSTILLKLSLKFLLNFICDYCTFKLLWAMTIWSSQVGKNIGELIGDTTFYEVRQPKFEV